MFYDSEIAWSFQYGHIKVTTIIQDLALKKPQKFLVERMVSENCSLFLH